MYSGWLPLQLTRFKRRIFYTMRYTYRTQQGRVWLLVLVEHILSWVATHYLFLNIFTFYFEKILPFYLLSIKVLPLFFSASKDLAVIRNFFLH